MTMFFGDRDSRVKREAKFSVCLWDSCFKDYCSYVRNFHRTKSCDSHHGTGIIRTFELNVVIFREIPELCNQNVD